MPWIDAGIVEVIRTPADFDRELNREAVIRASALKSDPELAAMLEATVGEFMDRHFEREKTQHLLLSVPDSALRRKFHELNLGRGKITEAQFIEHINRMRDRDPDFLEPLGDSGPKSGQLHIKTTGGTYEIARLTAQMSRSYLFTDLAVRWKLIERDREALAAESIVWSPFAKAIQNTKLTYLNNLNADHALRLRRDGKLEGVRSVLREAWSRERVGTPFSEDGAIYLANNLNDAVREAEAEWIEIKAEILKVSGLGAGAMSAASLIAAGNALWMAGAAAIGGAGLLGFAKYKNQAFQKRFPAAFFMDLKEDD